MKYSTLTDRKLVGRARAGDQRAFRHLVERTVRPALAVAWEFTETLEDAEDMVQEAFRRVVGTLDRFDTGRPFRPWFYTILRNVARSRSKSSAGSRALLEELSEPMPDLEPSPLEQVEGLELKARVDLEMETLPEMQRVCFRLCVLEGLTSGEVGEALGLSDATVRTHVFRARQVMRAAVQPFAEDREML